MNYVTDADRKAAMAPEVSVGYTEKTRAKILRGEKDTDALVQAFARHRESAFEDGIISTFPQRAMDLRDVEKRSHEDGFRAGALAMRQAAVQIIADAIASIDPDTLENPDA